MEELEGMTTIDNNLQNNEEVNEVQPVICSKCGVQIGEDQDFCPKCGTPKTGEQKRICSKCGVELQEGQDFCPKCGTKYDPDASASGKVESKKKKGNKLAIIIPVIVVALIAIGGAVWFFFFRGIPVSEVAFSKEALTITEGKTASIVSTITPDNATDKTLTWTSSNESVAKVDGSGTVTAVAEGVCTITATASNGISCECKVTVEKLGPDFKSLYSKFCKATWSSIGADGSYLSVDTNPFDIDDYGLAYPEAYEAIQKINVALGLPSSLAYDMGHTTANQGKQSETFNNVGVTVMWTYHPDKGLEVVYKATNK